MKVFELSKLRAVELFTFIGGIPKQEVVKVKGDDSVKSAYDAMKMMDDLKDSIGDDYMKIVEDFEAELYPTKLGYILKFNGWKSEHADASNEAIQAKLAEINAEMQAELNPIVVKADKKLGYTKKGAELVKITLSNDRFDLLKLLFDKKGAESNISGKPLIEIYESLESAKNE